MTAAVAVVLLALWANWPALANGFTLDDRFIVLLNSRIQRGEFSQYFSQSWWPPGVGTGLYRPLTMTALGLEWALGGGTPVAFHAVSLALHALVSLAVLALAGTLLQPALAFGVAALFAVHPVHVEAVANIVGQGELIVALVLLVAVAAYIEDRRAGPVRPQTAMFIVGAGFAALFAKEHAVVLPALLIAAELFTPLAAIPARARWGRLAVITGASAGFTVIWIVARINALGGFAGEVPLLLYQGRSMLSRARLMLGVVPEWMRLLVWPRRLYAEYLTDPAHALPLLRSRELLGAMLVVGAVVAVLACRRRLPAMALGVVAFAISISPVANVVVPTGILLAERTLYLPSAFFLIACMGAVTLLVRERSAVRSAALAGVLAVLVVAGVVRSRSRTLEWKDDETVFRTLVRDAPDNAHARQLLGYWFFEHGHPAEGEREYRTAIQLTPADASLPEQLGWQYVNHGMCVPAEPLFREAIRVGGPRQPSTIGLADCLLARGQADEVRRLVRRALVAGGDAPSLYRRLRAAETEMAKRRRP
ncbi:MAG: tetratricopeptide repeat protein [Gemmatimonadaceae bacterium]